MTLLTLFWPGSRLRHVATYAMEPRSPWWILAFAGACLLGSAYGFLQGAWPFGLVEAIWALVATGRFWKQDAQAMKPANTLLTATGTTIFTVMSALAAEHGAINLGQGFPTPMAPRTC